MPGSGRARVSRLLRVTLVAAAMTATAGLLSASGSPAPARAGTSPAGTSPAHRGPQPGSPLAGIAAYLSSRQGVVQVAAYNRGTGRTSLLSTGDDTQYTASIVKADILAMWLRRYQGFAAPIPGVIPFSVKYLMTSMITMSDNVAATSLFYFGGGCNALTAFNRLIPTRATTVGCETPTYYGWGNTTTTAADQTRIVRTLAYPNQVLRADARSYGLQLMENVIPSQRWGVTCGPWGTACDPPDYARPVPGVTVALKNGWKFVPTCTRQDDTCPWQVNSIGWVHGDGRDYVLAVLTTDDPAGPGLEGFNYGITTIQGVSQLVWDNLSP
ncbi:MAG TPA: serine hydrolase [Streptosporangiaceae bacterium]|nr:serine hydrolase [Streptosporangiaceae bacterium]